MATQKSDLSKVDTHIDVNVPVGIAYDHWTHFERFPRFMGGVESVDQISPDRYHFKVNVGTKTVEYDAAVTAKEPHKLISWKATDGRKNLGTVTFEPLGPDRTRVGLHLGYDTEGLVEAVGDVLGFVGRRAKSDLQNFKEMVEEA